MLIETILSRKMRQMCRSHFARTIPASHPLTPARKEKCLLYLHIPFCESLCTYCSFNRIEFDPDLAHDYFEALDREMLLYKDLGYEFDSAYIGGGTPTVLPDRLLRTIEKAKQLWPIKHISVETNANHLTEPILDTLKSTGVDRLSVGIQTFDDKILSSIGRLEQYGSGNEMRKRVAAARGRFHTLNLDMIFNLPGQSMEILERDLSILDELEPNQVTFYPFMTTSSVAHNESLHRPDSRNEKRMYKLIMSALRNSYQQASAWCFSRTPGSIDEYIVSHNNYAGLGAGSFGFVDGVFYANRFSIPEYIQTLNSGRTSVTSSRRLTGSQTLHYELLMRLFSGSADLAALTARHRSGARLMIETASLLLTLSGSAVRDGSILRLTPRGRYLLVILMREFFTGVDEFRTKCAQGPSPSHEA